MLRLWFHVLFISLLQAPLQDAPYHISKYARVIYEQSTASSPAVWRVQTSIRTLTLADKSRTVTLISMQHIGKKEYFSTIKAYLKSSDAAICEGWDKVDVASFHPDLGWLKRFRAASAKVLQLAQQDAIEAEAGLDLIRIDIATDTMKKLMAEVKSIVPEEQKALISKLEAFDERGEKAEEAESTRTNLMRFWMTEVRNHDLVSASTPLASLNQERDKAITAGIRDYLKSTLHKKVVLMYGAGHAGVIEKMLTEQLGFKVDAAIWVDSLEIAEMKATPSPKPSGVK